MGSKLQGPSDNQLIPIGTGRKQIRDMTRPKCNLLSSMSRLQERIGAVWNKIQKRRKCRRNGLETESASRDGECTNINNIWGLPQGTMVYINLAMMFVAHPCQRAVPFRSQVDCTARKAPFRLPLECQQ